MPDLDRVSLPIWQTVVGAWKIVLGNLVPMVKLIAVPAILISIVTALDYTSLGILGVAGGEISFSSWAALAGATLIAILSMVPTITAWHRLGIFGLGHPGQPVTYRVSSTEWSYIRRAIIVMLALALVLIPAQFILLSVNSFVMSALRQVGAEVLINYAVFSWLLWVPVWLLAGVVSCRVSLALPAAAMGHPLGVGDSWDTSGGNGFRIFFATVIATAPFWAIDWGIDELGRRGVEGAGATVLLGVGTLSYVLASLIGLSVLSLAFRDIVLRREGLENV